MKSYSDLLEKIPNYSQYMTVDETKESTRKLVEECPEDVELLELGKSGNGELIDCIKIGDGPLNALIYGFPNPEEPFGGLILDFMSRELAENQELREDLGFTWYFIKCIDPDGARLNEGFQKGPYTPLNFTLNYYRTPNSQVGEKSFPFRYGPLDLDNPVPETRALMKLMDRRPFHLLSSLHMMKWGGITYDLPAPTQELYAPLLEVAKEFQIFPRKRIQWNPGFTLPPGFSVAAWFTPAKNYIREWAKGTKAIEQVKGCFIYEYGQILNPNIFIMVPECCMWYDPGMYNDDYSDMIVNDIVQYEADRRRETNTFMMGVWDEAEPLLVEPSPFKAMVDEVMEPIKNPVTNVTNPQRHDPKVYARKATEAERIGVMAHAHLYRMFYLGGIIRALKHQLSHDGDEKLEGLLDQTNSKLQEYDRYLNDNYNVTSWPIRSLVGLSIGSILHTADYVKKKNS